MNDPFESKITKRLTIFNTSLFRSVLIRSSPAFSDPKVDKPVQLCGEIGLDFSPGKKLSVDTVIAR